MKAKKSFTAIIIAILIIPLFTSCQKDPVTLILGDWDFVNISTTSTDEGIISLTALGKALLTDGTMEFQANGTVIQSVPLLDDDQIGTWSLVGDEQLVLIIERVSSTNTIDKLTKSDLQFTETFIDVNTQEPYTTTSSWTRAE